MSRRYYKPKRVIPKQKWSINLTNVATSTPTVDASSFSVAQVNLINNPSRTDASGSANFASAAILKAGRFRFKGVISSGMSVGQSCIVALMYLPELINAASTSTATTSLGSTAFYCHPEWVVGWTRVDYANAAQRNEVSLTSKLKRNLNPGDKLALVVMNINYGTASASAVDLAGTFQYLVKNN